MQTKIIRSALTCGVLAAAWLLVPGCYYGYSEYGPHHRVSVEAGPVVPGVGVDTYYVEEGRHGPLHDYYYYPDAGVYFDPISVNWYWNDHGGWHHGHDLPRHYHVNEHARISFHTDAHHPYDVHERIQSRHYEHREQEHHH